MEDRASPGGTARVSPELCGRILRPQRILPQLLDFQRVPDMTNKLNPAPLAYQNEPFLSSPDGRILRILAEYQEPLSRFRREQIQDTVVFFGSARFQGMDAARKALTGAEQKDLNAPAGEQEKELKRASAAVDMARYYEDARRLAHMLTEWSIQIPAR